MKNYETQNNELNSIIDGLENDLWFYEVDIEYEYTPFEEAVKKYCDSYWEYYMANNGVKLFFDSLTRIINAMVKCCTYMYDEDFSRPAELITYYFGKIISHDNDLKDYIHDWIMEFSHEHEEDMIVEDYFKPFIKGEKIYPADSYYTNYKDLNQMLRVFK